MSNTCRDPFDFAQGRLFDFAQDDKKKEED